MLPLYFDSFFSFFALFRSVSSMCHSRHYRYRSIFLNILPRHYSFVETKCKDNHDYATLLLLH